MFGGHGGHKILRPVRERGHGPHLTDEKPNFSGIRLTSPDSGSWDVLGPGLDPKSGCPQSLHR